MTRKNIALFVFLSVSLFFSAMSFAQSAPPKVLSGKDVDMFVKNFEKIDADLSALGDKYDDLFRGDENASPAALSASIHAAKVPVEVQSILRKHGLGDNGFEKIMVITLGFTLLEMDEAVRQQKASMESNPEANAYLDQSLAQMKDLRSAIHADDLSLIDSRRDQIRPVITDEERD